MKKKPGNRFDHLEFEEPVHQPISQTVGQSQEGVLASAPMERHAYHDRAIQAFHRGDFEQAMRYFTRTLELDRGFVPAWVGQVQMLVELGELREADLWADKALELFHENGELLATKAVARARLKDKRAASACSDAAISARGSSAYRWLARGEAMLAYGASDVGACFDRAMLEPDADWFTRLWIGRIYRHYHRPTQALVAARQATEEAPHAPFAWYIRGLCERDLAMTSSRKSLERAIELDGTYLRARTALRERSDASWLKRVISRLRGQ